MGKPDVSSLNAGQLVHGATHHAVELSDATLGGLDVGHGDEAEATGALGL